MNSAKRLKNLREYLRQENASAFLVARSSNVDYITALDEIHDEEDPHYALVTLEDAVLITDTRYVEVAANQLKAGIELKVLCETEPVIEVLKKELETRGIDLVIVEDTISYAHFKQLEEKLAPITFKPASNIIENIRSVKDEDEIARIRKAQEISDAAFKEILKHIKEGVSEKELAALLGYTLLQKGADDLAFPIIVASGPNGSLPHAVPGERTFKPGDFITMDFGAEYKGYKSDMTRTVALGAVSDKQREVYDTVLAANFASLKVARAGMSGSDIDKAGRDIINKAGYGDYFGHGTGHGVGIDIHEAPTASPRSTTLVKENQTLTIEPGIYLPGAFGVRIEDLVVLKESGVENLSSSPKELIEL